uniref:Uncharacterized protein n=1 Tax=Acrobeloides nanus TaxID=290746 RepID=A0A914D4T9_9BILA
MATSYRTMKFRTMAEIRTRSRRTLSYDNAFLSYDASHDASYDKNALSYDAIVLHCTTACGDLIAFYDRTIAFITISIDIDSKRNGNQTHLLSHDIMVIYKDFTLREIQDSISNGHTKLSSSMTEDAVSWLHEALKLHTSRDGSCRDKQEIVG